jgi:cytidine deaminase
MESMNQLIRDAVKMKENAYIPYSKFPVGAAVLAKSGTIYTGCNIENASYPLTCCAERVAIFKAVSAGDQEFLEMAVSANTTRPVPPCGACRQVMAEFFPPTMKIHLINKEEKVQTVTVEELLPFSFQTDDLQIEE